MSTSSDESIIELLNLLSSSSSDYSSDSDYESNKKCIRINFMEKLNENEFTYRFRLNKTAVNNLLLEIYPFIKVTSARNHGIAPLHQLLLTLRFYAVGTMLVSVAEFVGVSKASASRTVKSISFAIAKLYPKYVKFHKNTEQDFYPIAKFPKVLGVIDTTHITIQSPDSSLSDEFRNKKGRLSINVQAVCNAELIFMNIIANYPGSTHDATIFHNSILKTQCEDKIFGECWLLGDSAYPCTDYLLTPISTPSNQNEILYNESHMKTRSTIERCFQVWKRRFPVLSVKLRLALDTIESVIIATGVLHNICRQLKLEDLEPEVEIPNNDTEDTTLFNTISGNMSGSNNRNVIIDQYFSRYV